MTVSARLLRPAGFHRLQLILGQDGITNGAIYALPALAPCWCSAVTRVIFIPQESLSFGALTPAR